MTCLSKVQQHLRWNVKPPVRLLILSGAALLLAAACGGGGEISGTPTTPPDMTATPRAMAPAFLCQNTREPLPQWNVQITAKWKGKDHIVIEGSADLPGTGTVNYWVCQDGQATNSLQPTRQPEFKNGKITAESKVVEGPVGPVFDPNAHFDVMLSILGEPVRVPYFITRVPVQGTPQ
jgi:hypothetical protein